MSGWETDEPVVQTKTRLHALPAPDDPVFLLYRDIVREIDSHVDGWHRRAGLTVAQRNQAVASALMSQTTYYFMSHWKLSREEFLQMAAEEWDMRVPDEVRRRLKNATLLVVT